VFSFSFFWTGYYKSVNKAACFGRSLTKTSGRWLNWQADDFSFLMFFIIVSGANNKWGKKRTKHPGTDGHRSGQGNHHPAHK